jgi:hypothetical protein
MYGGKKMKGMHGGKKMPKGKSMSYPKGMSKR